MEQELVNAFPELSLDDRDMVVNEFQETLKGDRATGLLLNAFGGGPRGPMKKHQQQGSKK